LGAYSTLVQARFQFWNFPSSGYILTAYPARKDTEMHVTAAKPEFQEKNDIGKGLKSTNPEVPKMIS
jgi:hypothetical protein